MDERTINSLGQLQNFISEHKLKNRNSDVNFYAKVFITTARVTKKEEDIEIIVNFNSDKGIQIIFLEHNLPAAFYPTIFYPYYDDFVHENNEKLIITGVHTLNSDIGNYTIEIFPLGRVD